MTDPKSTTDDRDVSSVGEKSNADELDLSDGELIQVLKNHGTSRRFVMKAFGVGTVAAALGGTAAGKGGTKAGKTGRGNRIDDVYGAPYSAEEDTVPSGLVDHLVELHSHREPPGDHDGFPMVDSPEDGDTTPDSESGEFFFDPVGLHVKPGDVVNFTAHDPIHTVTSIHTKYLPLTRVPTESGFTSPEMVAGDSWLYRFTTKGVYDIVCLPHLSLGMAMRIVVFDPDEDSLEESAFDDWGPLPPAAGQTTNAVLTDDVLDPANIVEKGEVAWADLTLSSEKAQSRRRI